MTLKAVFLAFFPVYPLCEQIQPDQIVRLASYFAEDVRGLGLWLGRDLSNWLRVD